MNKSLVTNIVSLAAFALAYLLPDDWTGKECLKQAGLFAFSGALTNWLAVYMLFEKIPGIYGSGIVPRRFQDFKREIRNLIMRQFFTPENFERYLQQSLREKFDIEPLLDRIFDEFLRSIDQSSFGSMIGFLGGAKVLEPLRKPFKEKTAAYLQESDILAKLAETDSFGRLREQVETIVERKLEELTPERVKEIVQNIIRKHLGWLVVWGGIFGALIGVASASFSL